MEQLQKKAKLSSGAVTGEGMRWFYRGVFHKFWSFFIVSKQELLGDHLRGNGR